MKLILAGATGVAGRELLTPPVERGHEAEPRRATDLWRCAPTSWLPQTYGTPWCGALPVWSRSPVRLRWTCCGFASHGAQRRRPHSSGLEVATSS